MRQRSLDLTSPAFGKQAVAQMVDWLCQQLPLHAVGSKVTDAVLWTMLCYAATRQAYTTDVVCVTRWFGA